MEDEGSQPSEPFPTSAPHKASLAEKIIQRFGVSTVRAAVAVVGVVVLTGGGAVLRKLVTPKVVQVKASGAGAKAAPAPAAGAPARPALPKAAPAKAPPAAVESADAARKAVEARYAAGAKALMAKDLKGFLELKAPSFQCKLPDSAKGPALSPSVASTTLAAFAISSVSVRGDQLVVDNVEKIVQNVWSAKYGVRSVSSEISRRDTWIKADGTWRLSQTERLGFKKSESKAAKGGINASAKISGEDWQSGGETPDEKVADDCVNEIGILCYPVRDDIKAAKKCLKKYEGSWLAACRKTLAPPPEDNTQP